MSDTFMVPALAARVVMAREIVAARASVAAAVTEEFLQRQPDWLTRYGEKARVRGTEDAGYHIDFLAGAIESGSVAAFCEYARWCSRLLSGLGMAPQFLAENLEQISQHLSAKLGAPANETIASFTESAVAAALEAPGDPAAPGESALDSARSVFVQAILAGRRREALTVAREAVRQGHTVAGVYVHVFQEALYEVGRLWERGRITVAQEHMATATVQYVIAQMYSELPLAARARGKAIVTGVQGEFHQVGANIVADMLEMDGWNVRFLGTNMPHRGILAAIEEGGVDLLGISATMLFNLPQVRALVHEVREKLGAGAPRIVVGGGAFRLCPEFCTEMEVIGPASDVVTAVQLCAA
ncbi:MAG TPA: cobalamin-dependent protein [Chthoniobacterales bacterium]